MKHADLKQVMSIMEYFDFEKVQDFMVKANWVWLFPKVGVPTVEELQELATQLLLDVVKCPPDYSIATGGLVARKDSQGDLSLSFVLEEVYGNGL